MEERMKSGIDVFERKMSSLHQVYLVDHERKKVLYFHVGYLKWLRSSWTYKDFNSMHGLVYFQRDFTLLQEWK